MADYTITFARSARKELERLDRSIVARILTRVEALAHAPRPSGCKKLRGSAELWRIRIGDYCVVYSINDARRVVDIIAVRHRRDAYR